MSERTNQFEMKLLTTSKEVGLRRLRSYAASLGGSASIFHSYDELYKHLSVCNTTELTSRQVVLHDHTIKLSAQQIAALQKLARVFVLQAAQREEALPGPMDISWQTESYYQCSMHALLDSPVVRMTMAQMLSLERPFHIEHLLRWGHAASTWKESDAVTLGDHSLDFIRGLALTGEARRLVEMFNHFIQTRLDHLNLKKHQVVFGSDGLLMSISVHCDLPPRLDLRKIVDELRVHAFPIAAVNTQTATNTLEIAGLFYPHIMPEISAERIIMVFRKEHQERPKVSASLRHKAS